MVLVVICRARKHLNQNINESTHARLYGIVTKAKHYGICRLMFAAEYVSVENNFGKLGANIFSHWGEISQAEVSQLQALDKEMMIKAERRKTKKVAALKEVSGQYKYGFGFEEYNHTLFDDDDPDFE